MEMEGWETVFRHYVNDMKRHREAGVKLPSGVSAATHADKLWKLLQTVNQFQGPKEFEKEKEMFDEHVSEFEKTYNLERPAEPEPEEEPCKSQRRGA